MPSCLRDPDNPGFERHNCRIVNSSCCSSSSPRTSQRTSSRPIRISRATRLILLLVRSCISTRIHGRVPVAAVVRHARLSIFSAHPGSSSIRSPDESVDLAAIAPFWLQLLLPGALDLRFLRAMRLLRVFRLLRASCPCASRSSHVWFRRSVELGAHRYRERGGVDFQRVPFTWPSNAAQHALHEHSTRDVVEHRHDHYRGIWDMTPATLSDRSSVEWSHSSASARSLCRLGFYRADISMRSTA